MLPAEKNTARPEQHEREAYSQNGVMKTERSELARDVIVSFLSTGQDTFELGNILQLHDPTQDHWTRPPCRWAL